MAPLFGSFLVLEAVLFAHGIDNHNQDLLASFKVSLNVIAKGSFRDLDIVFAGSIFPHKRKESIVNVQDWKLSLGDIGDIHVVGRWTQIFQFLVGKDISRYQMDLGMSVLSGFTGGHVNNLAWSSLDANISTLAQSRALY
jgi:hypothetical protein